MSRYESAFKKKPYKHAFRNPTINDNITRTIHPRVRVCPSNRRSDDRDRRINPTRAEGISPQYFAVPQNNNDYIVIVFPPPPNQIRNDNTVFAVCENRFFSSFRLTEI